MTSIIVHDTVSLLRPLFTEYSRPKDRLPRALVTFEQLGTPLALALGESGQYGADVMIAARMDGYGALAGYQLYGLFNPTRRQEASAWAFERLADQGVLAQAKDWLAELCDFFQADHLPAELHCFIIPADPANRELMAHLHGLGCFAAPSCIIICIWPSAGNLARLGPTLARGLVLSLRWQASSSETKTRLADFLAMHGLASNFVAQRFPALAEPWLEPFRPATDWQAALAHIAQIYGLAHYDELAGNIYGSRITGETVSSAAAPRAHPLDDEEFNYAQEVIAGAVEATSPPQIAAYLYGDEAIALQGYTAAGLPNFAGFEVAHRWVAAHLAKTGQTVAEAQHAPSATLLIK